MLAVDYLARVGFDAALSHLGGPTTPEWVDEDDTGAQVAADEAAKQADHARVREAMLAAKPQPRSGDLDGVKWVCGVISWPDRVPGLKTWAGQASLSKIIAAHQRRLRDADQRDLFAATGLISRKKGEGPSGLDPTINPDPIDAGFSLSKVGVDLACRPGVELLAIIGLETVPLVSFGARECGFVHGGKVWQFAVAARSGGYFFQWADLIEYPLDDRKRAD